MNVAVMKTKAEQALTEAFEAVVGKLPVARRLKSGEPRPSVLSAPWFAASAHRGVEIHRSARQHQRSVAAGSPRRNTADDRRIDRRAWAAAHVGAHRIAFVNGRHRADLDDVGDASGLEIATLEKALASAPDKVAEGLANVEASGAIASLNTAFMTDGAIVRIADEATLAKPLLVVFVRAGSQKHSVAVRNVISVGKKATATIIEAHVSLPGAAKEAQSNAFSEVTVGDAAKLNHVKVAVDEGKCVHLANWDISLGTDAKYHGFQFSSGLGLARNEINVLYTGEGGKLDLSGAYMARGHEHIDTTLVVDHAVPACESRELFKGVIDNHGRGVFQGKIIVRPDAQKTDGKQMSQALMLSEDAEFDSKPELEIFADDVVCGHGTTSAELDPDLLFYCRSRGIPESEARALMIESFIGEAIDKVENTELHAALMTLATNWLAGMARG